MKSIKQLLRLLHINTILARNGLDQVIVSIRLFSPFRFIVYLNPWNWLRKQKLTRGEALRKTLEELGPIFIKFGQALSTRPDILPPDIAAELCKLQDKVPPFSSEIALKIIETAFGRSAFQVFAHFDPQPLASASVAQVHAATLRSGEEVVVKILRPNIRKTIENDLSIMYTMANFADRYWSESKRLKPKEIVQEFEHNLLDELDLQREAANAGQLRRNFSRSPLLYIPEVFWDYTRENVMVMERIYGIPVSDLATLQANRINIKKLAERGVEIFFTQVFRDCFFHADMHPGNIFVSPQRPEDPQYICIDFGIIGTLNDSDKRYLAENLYAFFNRDYRRVAQLHVESGWVARDTRVEEFESAIRTVCEPIFEKPLKDISFAQVVLRLFQVARRFQMEVQPQLVLLQKTLLAIEGLGRQLYPELDLWATAKPFLEKWLKEQMGPKAFVKQLRENLPFLTEQLPHMPRLLHEVLELTKEQKIRALEQRKAKKQATDFKKNWYKGLGVGIFAAMIAVSGLSYLNILNYDKLAPIALIAAITGGFISLINRTK
ncbi:ubiquinone biosynthesis regulatory protein kinase UbiB [Legionella micdadei]|uniref:Probable protein kinase UbiB n=1 Tax=Legionella micdadei TaxID=451 RepID=A0A098GBV6_LEGMI|nr:ubiquinone biosynthesis regulatory protein kinase UbiB [Legionella micdadei]ARG99018.1 ubiquinone biosynthesis regulatory protein kinase UbiB [Legionella micdadei]KTD29082.1 ubiquinone biosynthesis AarF [Legionella micdadei]NSL17290.1 ubiquinone biosynthesis regulatory protein kinase UbiB [Legionella micdadei]CEG59445.1 putative ubiquinone biosynthesis protein ubiB [Legionella micdadei]SCX90166.1 2-octaprenylphenol hydroxylase [Legionella micdadei]